MTKGPNARARRESGIVQASYLIAWELFVSGSSMGRVIAEWKDPQHLRVYSHKGLKFDGRDYSPHELPEAIGTVGDDIMEVAKIYSPNRVKVVPVAFDGKRHVLESYIKTSPSQTSYS